MEHLDEKKKTKKKDDDVKKISLTVLRNMLKKDIVEFKYKKKDGSIRKAKGTLKKSLIPEIDKDSQKRDFPEECFGYYDIDREDWRMFLRDNFIGIIETKEDKK